MNTIDKDTLTKQSRGRSTYIETGTYMGGSAKSAIAAGYKVVHTIDINTSYSKHAPAGSIFHGGKSIDVLPKLIEEIDKNNESVVFFLDGHTNCGKFTKDSMPLLEEIAIIATSKRNDHVIIIDDMYHMRHCFNDKPSIEDSTKRIQELIKAINDKYEFEFFDFQKKYKSNKFMICVAK